MIQRKLHSSAYALAGSAALLAMAGIPFIANAQNIDNIGDLVGVIVTVINSALVPLILALAFIVFIWGVFRYFIASNEETKEKGRDLMIYGLIGFFVIISVWGIVSLLVNTFNLDETGQAFTPPTVQGP